MVSIYPRRKGHACRHPLPTLHTRCFETPCTGASSASRTEARAHECVLCVHTTRPLYGRSLMLSLTALPHSRGRSPTCGRARWHRAPKSRPSTPLRVHAYSMARSQEVQILFRHAILSLSSSALGGAGGWARVADASAQGCLRTVGLGGKVQCVDNKRSVHMISIYPRRKGHACRHPLPTLHTRCFETPCTGASSAV